MHEFPKDNSSLRQAPQGRIKPVFLVFSAFSFLAFTIALGSLVLVPDQEKRAVYLDILSPIADFIVAITLFYVTQNISRHSRRLVFAWGIIAAAIFSYWLGDSCWALLELVLKEPPFPSIADGFYLAYYPLFLIGVIILQGKLSKPSELIKKVIDIGIVLLSGTLGYWNFLIGPIKESNASLPFLEQLITLAYPVNDLLLFGALLVILFKQDNKLGPSAGLLAGSLLITVVADSIFSYQSLLGTYYSGTILDVTWMGSSLLVGFAGMFHLISLESNGAAQKHLPAPRISSLLRNITVYFPYIWLAGSFGLLIIGAKNPLPMNFFTLSVFIGGVVCLVFIRQIITLIENNGLNQQLTVTNLELKNEIAERERIQKQLSYDSLHDSMTGLPNRSLFMDRLGQAIEYTRRNAEQRFGILFIDLDQFKIINDSLGHLLGDQLLVLVSQRLRQSLRSSDTIARFGGDEFEVLLDVTSAENTVLDLAEKVQTIFKNPFLLEGHEVFITASMGILPSLTGYESADDVIRDSDIAMYQAKALGGGRSEVFNVHMRNRAYFRLEMENELRMGLDTKEFQLYYQPIILLETNHLTGFEALIRWNHPKRGILLPNEFLPIAEESGLIIPIGDWVIHQACLNLKSWQDRYPLLKNAYVNVNISSRQFSQPDFLIRVKDALDTSGLAPETLRLEITEGVLIDNYATANELFYTLRSLGVQLQIDDFGTGYSALGYLQHFPINTIKIDKSFINEIGKSHKGVKLVRAIVSMAHELGMETIGEGIETDIQLEELRRLLCKSAQGFLISEPLNPQEMDTILSSHNPDKLLFAGLRGS